MGKGARAQQMTLGTIILIVLGIAALVFLIYGFSTGWGNLWDRVTNYGGGESNLATIETACELACTQQGTSGYCTTKRTVIDSEGKRTVATCNELVKAKTYGLAECTALATECPQTTTTTNSEEETTSSEQQTFNAVEVNKGAVSKSDEADAVSAKKILENQEEQK